MVDKSRIVIDSRHLDDGTVVVELELLDKHYETEAVSGFVEVSKGEDEFIVTVNSVRGHVISKTVVPFDFVTIAEINQILDEEEGE
jgi:hypothetical protein